MFLEPVYLSIKQKATGNKISELLKKNGYTVKDVPSVDNLLILSRILHTSIEDILVVDEDIGGFIFRLIGVIVRLVCFYWRNNKYVRIIL